MNKSKLIFFAVGLGMILVAGQPHAIMAAYDNNLGESIAPNGFLSTTQDYSVDIYSAGPSGLENYTAVSDDLYHIESDNAVTMVRLSASVSGFNTYDNVEMSGVWDDDNNENTTDVATSKSLNDVAYAGELYVIVNGKAARASASFLTGTGTDVPVVPGMNTVSLLYIGRDQDGSVTWASDTVNIRVFGSADDSSVATETTVLNYKNSVTDLAVAAVAADEKMNITDLIYWNWGEHGKNKVFEPLMDIGASFEFDTIEFTGTTDTSGFHGAYHFENFNFTTSAYDGPAMVPRTAGVTLIQDLNGLQVMGDSGTVTLLDSDDDFSTVSLVSLADYGTWDLNSDYYGYGVDWDGQFTSVGLSAEGTASLNTSDPEELGIAQGVGWASGFFGTNDFEVEEWSISFKLLEKLTDTTATRTSTVSQNVTVTGEVDTDAAAAPGFGVVVTLLSIGTIAYLTPRLRKEL
jgi:hypothetical protein